MHTCFRQVCWNSGALTTRGTPSTCTKPAANLAGQAYALNSIGWLHTRRAMRE